MGSAKAAPPGFRLGPGGVASSPPLPLSASTSCSSPHPWPPPAESPIVFIGTGEHFDDFEVFEVRSFVSRLLGMGDVGGLMNAIKDAGLDKQPELYQKLSQGVFTLRWGLLLPPLFLG